METLAWVLVLLLIVALVGWVWHFENKIAALHKEANMRERKHMAAISDLELRHTIELEVKDHKYETLSSVYRQLYDSHTELERRALNMAGCGDLAIQAAQSNNMTVLVTHETYKRFYESVDKLEELIKP